MATKRTVKLANASGWIGTAAGPFAAHTITVDIPVGPRYHELWIHAHPGAGNALVTNLLGDIRLKVNGKVQREFSAIQLNKLNVLNGPIYASKGGLSANTEAAIGIFLAEPWRENEGTQDGLAWATGDVSTFQMEVDIQAYAGAAAGLTAPTFYARIDNSLVEVGGNRVDAPLGAIVKVRRVQIPFATGWNDFTQFPKNDFYQSIHLQATNITEFQVKVDQNVIREDTSLGNQARLVAHGMLPSPSAEATPWTAAADMPARGMVDIVFDEDDRVSSSLPMQFNGRRVGEYVLRFNASSSSGNVTCLYQTIGPAD